MTFTGLRKGHGHDYDVNVNTEDDNSSEDVKDPSTGASKAQVTIRLSTLCPCQNDHLLQQIGQWGADTYRNHARIQKVFSEGVQLFLRFFSF